MYLNLIEINLIKCNIIVIWFSNGLVEFCFFVSLVCSKVKIMATLKFTLQSKKDNAPIYARLSIKRGKIIYRKTGLTINHNQWSNKTGYPKQTNPNNKNTTSELRKLENHIFEHLNKINIDEVTGDWLRFNIDLFFKRVNEQKVSEYVADAIETYIKNAPTRKNAKGGIGLSKSRIETLKGLQRLFTQYEQKTKKRYKVKQINIPFSNSFLSFLIDELRYSKSYSLKKIDDLKTVCYAAEIYGVEVSPQLKKVVTGKPKRMLPVYLSNKELNKIKGLKILSQGLQNARKWLILGCNIGQRGSDLLNITYDNFVTRKGLLVIELEQEKGGKIVTIPVLDDVKEIYDNELPYKISIQKFNEYIKELCKLAEIKEVVRGNKICMLDEKGNIIPQDEKGNYIKKGVKRNVEGDYPKHELVSSHICRRSFATNNYGMLPTPLIMQIMAHSTEKMFLKYIGKNSLDYAKQIADFYELQKLRNQEQPQLEVIKKASNQ